MCCSHTAYCIGGSCSCICSWILSSLHQRKPSMSQSSHQLLTANTYKINQSSNDSNSYIKAKRLLTRLSGGRATKARCLRLTMLSDRKDVIELQPQKKHLSLPRPGSLRHCQSKSTRSARIVPATTTEICKTIALSGHMRPDPLRVLRYHRTGAAGRYDERYPNHYNCIQRNTFTT
jgi:hypothetical protein